MKTYRITTTAETADGTARDDVWNIEADVICIKRGGIRAYRRGPRPTPKGRIDRFVLAWELSRRPHRFDELVAWVPGDSLVSVRLIAEDPESDETDPVRTVDRRRREATAIREGFDRELKARQVRADARIV